MVELKVRKIGNSLGVVLPKEVIEELRTGEGKKLFLRKSPDGTYVVTPFDVEFEKQMKIAEECADRYRNTLRELAK
jgi:putative addiction module antidote